MMWGFLGGMRNSTFIWQASVMIGSDAICRSSVFSTEALPTQRA